MMSNPLVQRRRAAQVREGRQRASARATSAGCAATSSRSRSSATCLLRQLSAEAGAAETILFRDGKLTEASASNVFVVKGGVILSPPKSELILPGITYDVVGRARARQRPAARVPRRHRGRSARRRRDLGHLVVEGSARRRRARRRARSATASPGPVFRRMYQLYQDFKQQGDARRQAGARCRPEGHRRCRSSPTARSSRFPATSRSR